MPEQISIYVEYDEEAIPDWKEASQHVYPLPGNLAVGMLPPKDKTKGGVFLTESSLQTWWQDDGTPVAGIEPSVGCVIGIGPNVDEFEYGDLVICLDGDGFCMEGFTAGSYEAQGEVRMLGKVVPVGMGDGCIEDLPIEESVVAVLTGDPDYPYRPTGRNVLIKKNPFQKQSGMIHLLNQTQVRDCEATVIAVGPKLECAFFDHQTLDLRVLKVGDRVKYHSQACYDFRDGDNPDYAFIREIGILAVVE